MCFHVGIQQATDHYSPAVWQAERQIVYWNRYGSIMVGESYAYNADVEEHSGRGV
jgi:hypothetical protein